MARTSAGAWWREKAGRVVSWLFARVGADELAEVGRALTAGEVALFETMPRPDQRHGLDVAHNLGLAGFGDDRELIAAALLHDAGKGRSVHLWHRVVWSLGQRYGHRFVGLGAMIPGAGPVFDRLEHHAQVSADLARAAGSSERTVALIAEQADPHDPAAHVMHLADEGELPVRT